MTGHSEMGGRAFQGTAQAPLGQGELPQLFSPCPLGGSVVLTQHFLCTIFSEVLLKIV